jgi:hypothetical protein
MKNKQVITFSLLSLIFLAFAGTGYAQTVLVGVSTGGVYTYDYTLTWSSTDPTQTSIPSEFLEYSKIQSVQISVQSISGSTINTEVKTYYKNGTDVTQNGYVDVSSGAVHVPFGFVIARSGMNANEKIYPFGGESTINDTTQRIYATGPRETSHNLIEISSASYYEKTELYFDKQLGIAVNYNYESRATTGGFTNNFTEALVNTNSAVWAVNPVSSATPSPTPPPSSTNPTLTPTATATDQIPNPTSNPTSNNGDSTIPTSPQSTTDKQLPTNLIVVIAVILIIVLLGVVAVALRKKKKPLSESEEIIRNLKK